MELLFGPILLATGVFALIAPDRATKLAAAWARGVRRAVTLGRRPSITLGEEVELGRPLIRFVAVPLLLVGLVATSYGVLSRL